MWLLFGAWKPIKTVGDHETNASKVFCLDLLGSVQFQMTSFLTNLPFSFRCHVPVPQNWLGLVRNQGKEAKVIGSLHGTGEQSEGGTGFNYQVVNGLEQKKIALK